MVHSERIIRNILGDRKSKNTVLFKEDKVTSKIYMFCPKCAGRMKNKECENCGYKQKNLRPLGKAEAFGYYSNCPRCGGKMITEKSYNTGFGSQSAGHVDQKCEECG